MKRIVPLSIFVLLIGCKNPTPVVVPPTPTAKNIDLIIQDSNDHHPLSAVAYLNGNAQETNNDGYVRFTVSSDYSPINFIIKSEGYQDYVVDNLQVIKGFNYIYLTQDRAFPAEFGKVNIVGDHFVDSNNNLWDWRGYSYFLGFARYYRGDDITSDLQGIKLSGPNVLRIFLNVPWGGEWEYWRNPENNPDYWDKLDGYLELIENNGIRVEITCLTYSQDLSKQRSIVDNALRVASGHWNTFVEVANEPSVNGIKTRETLQGLDKRGVLVSLGDYDPKDGKLDHEDYITAHTVRANDWARRAKDLLEYRKGGVSVPAIPGYSVPIVGDEPYGAGEVAVNGGGARSTNQNDFIAYFGICSIFSAGCTYHSQAGLEGRFPNAGEPIQLSILNAIRDNIWKKVGPQWQLGHYTAGHLSDCPLSMTFNDDRIYCMIVGNSAQCAQVPDSRGTVAPVRNGWNIVDRWYGEGYITNLVH